MFTYYPIAEYNDQGEKRNLSTYDSSFNVDACIRQVNLWQNDYHYDLQNAGVQVYFGGVLKETLPLKPVFDKYGKVCRWTQR